ncbi:MAG: type II toxin-antitoxin system RelE/ParE family toxin [Bacteriovoracales bacterium]|nr:type II toxin-antitoxin system RelE/ParE family toxin [Bacteriovoracales bacterium]
MAGKKKAKELFKRAYDAPNGFKINYCLVGDRYPVEEFIDGLTEEEQNLIMALLNLLGDQKGRLSTIKYKCLNINICGMVYEFKIRQIRIACFTRPDYNYNLIYGFKKKTNQWPKKHMSNMRANCKLFKEVEEKGI